MFRRALSSFRLLALRPTRAVWLGFALAGGIASAADRMEAGAPEHDGEAAEGVVILTPTHPGTAPIDVAAAHRAAKAQEPIMYPSSGLRITGLLSKPEGAGPFPLVLINHGGFEPAQTVGRLLDLYARLGYVALASNYRGVADSEGRRELAKGEVDDVLAAIEWAGTLPYVDARRVVLWGFSHGGTIALLAAARNPAIKGVVTVGAPIEWAECYRAWTARAKKAPALKPLLALATYVGGTPDKVPEAWRARSPLYVADRIKCPVLLVQGGKDEAVPPEQAQKMLAALQAAGNTRSVLLADKNAAHVLDGEAFARHGRPMVEFLNRAIGRKTPSPKKKATIAPVAAKSPPPPPAAGSPGPAPAATLPARD